MKYLYFTIYEENNETKNGHTRAARIREDKNILNEIKPKKGYTIKAVYFWDTWKEAQYIANIQNESAKNKNCFDFTY